MVEWCLRRQTFDLLGEHPIGCARFDKGFGGEDGMILPQRPFIWEGDELSFILVIETISLENLL